MTHKFLPYLIGILLLNGCHLPIRNVSAMRRAQTEAIATAVAATRAVPGPLARILQPQFSAQPRTPSQVNVIVEYNNIPQDRYMWVVVRVPVVKPNWLVYPQMLDGVPPRVTGNGIFETRVGLGVQEDAGQPFNIVVLLLDEEAHSSFIAFADKCLVSGNCGGILLPDTGVQILDFTTVIRE
jgi:hypothetical protein